MGINARIALAVLLVTGPLLFWLEWGFVAPNHWFWAKMGLVALMLVTVTVGAFASARAQRGDAAAAGLAARMGMITGLAFLGVILTAILAFN